MERRILKPITMVLPTLAFLLCCIASPAHAIPSYYTFSGTVYQAGDMYNPDLQLGGIAPGSQVSYTFLVDVDRTGYWASAEYGYYAEYVSGSNVITPGGNDMADGPFFFGDQSSFFGTVKDYPDSAVIIIFDNIDTLTGGSSAEGWNAVRGSIHYDIYSNLTLSSIFPAEAPSSSVPEPSTMLLLGSGLLGLVSLNRRRKA